MYIGGFTGLLDLAGPSLTFLGFKLFHGALPNVHLNKQYHMQWGKRGIDKVQCQSFSQQDFQQVANFQAMQ